MSEYVVTLKEVLKKREIIREIIITPEQKAELLEECDLNDILKLKGKFKISLIANNKGIGLEFYLSAIVLHECVVTLAPVIQTIKENHYLRFLPDFHDAEFNLSDSEIFLNDGINYDDDILKDPRINLYDIIHEYFVLALDPLPRVANADFKGYVAGNLDNHEKTLLEKNIDLIQKGENPVQLDNPFAALSKLKKNFDAGDEK